MCALCCMGPVFAVLLCTPSQAGRFNVPSAWDAASSLCPCVIETQRCYFHRRMPCIHYFISVCVLCSLVLFFVFLCNVLPLPQSWTLSQRHAAFFLSACCFLLRTTAQVLSLQSHRIGRLVVADLVDRRCRLAASPVTGGRTLPTRRAGPAQRHRNVGGAAGPRHGRQHRWGNVSCSGRGMCYKLRQPCACPSAGSAPGRPW